MEVSGGSRPSSPGDSSAKNGWSGPNAAGPDERREWKRFAGDSLHANEQLRGLQRCAAQGEEVIIEAHVLDRQDVTPRLEQRVGHCIGCLPAAGVNTRLPRDRGPGGPA